MIEGGNKETVLQIVKKEDDVEQDNSNKSLDGNDIVKTSAQKKKEKKERQKLEKLQVSFYFIYLLITMIRNYQFFSI